MQRLSSNSNALKIRRINVVALMLLSIFLHMPEDATAMEKIQELHWKNRVILIQTEDVNDYTSLLQEADSQIRDRHILWFILTSKEVFSNYPGSIGNTFLKQTKSKYFSAENRAVVLIGKDGGVKKRASSLQLQELFDLIDTMPMRRQEMGTN